MTPKQTAMTKLVAELRADTQAEKISALRKGQRSDLGLVNHFRKHDLIPNKWFDWVARADSSIMIIGQDWGPYSALRKYVDNYALESVKPDFDYSKFLFSTFSSRTEKFILKAVEQTYTEKFGKFDQAIWDDIIFTMAVLFTRQGEHFRGNHNFDPVQSALHSYPFVARQIEIVKPKIIVALGGMAFEVVNKYFRLGYEGKTITDVIVTLGQESIHADNTIIIPNFHPASHTDPKLQMQIWRKLWDNINYKLQITNNKLQITIHMQTEVLQQLIDHAHIGKLLAQGDWVENEIIIETTQGKFLVWKCEGDVWHTVRSQEIVPKLASGTRLMFPDYKDELVNGWIHFQDDYYAIFALE